jgi:transcriptional regulator GlxA family with amidase domain
MNVAVLLYNDVAELDAFGPYSVLAAARGALAEDALDLYTVARSRMSVLTAGGLVVTPHWAFMSAPAPDVLVVPGGAVDGVKRDRAVMGYLAEHAPKVRLLLGVGSGAFLLGELGLVRDQRATAWAGALERLRDYEAGEILAEGVAKNESGRWFVGGGASALAGGLELVRELFGEAASGAARERLELAARDP